MSFDYKNWLNRQITTIVRDDLQYSNFKFELDNELQFDESSDIDLYVVVKQLSGNIIFDYINSQPIQILLLSEKNKIDQTMAIANKLVSDNNYKQEISGTTFVKHEYKKPVVLNNFNELQDGYRSVIYISATLTIMENVADISDGTTKGKINVKKDGNTTYESVYPLSFQFNYTMNPDTQAFPSNELSITTKQSAGLSISFTLPLKNDLTFVSDLLNMSKGTSGYGGNTSFLFDFYLGSIRYQLSMKLLSLQLITAPNQVPSLQLGFIL